MFLFLTAEQDPKENRPIKSRERLEVCLKDDEFGMTLLNW